MIAWLKKLYQRYRAWCAENLRAHEAAKPSPCCSAPPPGAGKDVRRH
ncbi:hypothetical protein [Candidatus Dactylopiibacterium carminicum]|nr:hypothetical protein [Candidatus Dactylopiibacterium carminicum]